MANPKLEMRRLRGVYWSSDKLPELTTELQNSGYYIRTTVAHARGISAKLDKFLEDHSDDEVVDICKDDKSEVYAIFGENFSWDSGAENGLEGAQPRH